MSKSIGGVHASWLFVLLNPLLGIIFNIYVALRGRRVSLYSLSFSIVLIYMYLPLPWDVVHNYYKIYFDQDGFNFYQTGLFYLVEMFGFSYVAAIFMFSVLASFIMAFVFNGEVDKLRIGESRIYFLVFVVLYLTLIEFRFFLDLQKTFLSVAFYLLALSVKGAGRLVSMLMSVLLHPLMFILVVVYFLAQLSYGKLFLWGFFLLSLLLGFAFGGVLDSSDALLNSLFPSRIALYLKLSDESRYSSDSIMLLVKSLRLLSVFLIFYIFIKQIGFLKGRSRLLSTLVVFLCAFCAFVSFNEVALERYYFAMSVMAIYSAMVLRLDLKSMYVLLFAILLNVVVHGVYTLWILFTSYSYYGAGYDRLSMLSNVLMFPTVFLIFFEYFGQSESILIETIGSRNNL